MPPEVPARLDLVDDGRGLLRAVPAARGERWVPRVRLVVGPAHLDAVELVGGADGARLRLARAALARCGMGPVRLCLCHLTAPVIMNPGQTVERRPRWRQARYVSRLGQRCR